MVYWLASGRQWGRACWLIAVARESRWERERFGIGRAVWASPDDGEGPRLFDKIWWNPDGRSYSREKWQTAAPRPVTVREQMLRLIGQGHAEAAELFGRLEHDLVNEPLPLPGESELYDRFDVLAGRWLELQDLTGALEELMRNLSFDVLHEEVRAGSVLLSLDALLNCGRTQAVPRQSAWEPGQGQVSAAPVHAG
jgi:hypothetical protein